MSRLADLYRDTPEVLHVGTPALRADNLVERQPEERGPATLSNRARAWRDHSEVCRDLLAEDPTPYLLQWEGETQAEFLTRKKGSEPSFVNFYEDAVGGLVDKVFSKPLQLEDSPQQIVDFWGNVERRKRTPVTGDEFGRMACELSLGLGGTPAILVDHPPRDRPAADAGEERDQGLGPYFCLINPWQVIDVQEDSDGNLIHFRYFSPLEVPGEWGAEVVNRIIVLERGAVDGLEAMRRVFLQDPDDPDKWREDSAARRSFTPPATASPAVRARFREIPIVGVPTGTRSWWARPILRNVALLNVLHYRKRTDFDVAESIASVPMQAFIGFSDDEFAAMHWGPYRYVQTGKSPAEVAIQDISFGFQTSQTALHTLESLERYIAAKSKEPQSQRATGEEKATIRLIDEAKSMSRLQAWALGWRSSLQRALELAGAWMGVEEVGRLGYLDEVFEALDPKPTWADFRDFLAVISDVPPQSLPLAIQEAKRYGVIADTHETDDLIAELRAQGLEDGPA